MWRTIRTPRARLAESLRALPAGATPDAVFAMLKDKDIAGCRRNRCKDQVDEWLVAALPGPRGADVRAHRAGAGFARSRDAPVSCFDSPADAYRMRGEAARTR